MPNEAKSLTFVLVRGHLDTQRETEVWAPTGEITWGLWEGRRLQAKEKPRKKDPSPAILIWNF